MPNTNVLSPELRRAVLDKGHAPGDFGLEGGLVFERRLNLELLRNLTLYGLHDSLLAGKGRYFENVPQIGDEIRVGAVGLARFIGDLRDGLAIAGRHFKHNAHRFHTWNIAGQVGADAKAHIDSTAQRRNISRALGSDRLSENTRVLLIGSMPSL